MFSMEMFAETNIEKKIARRVQSTFDWARVQSPRFSLESVKHMIKTEIQYPHFKRRVLG